MTGFSNTRNNKGYTLVEAIVAMGIFVLIATLGTGIFTSILGAQTRTLQQQGTAQQLRFFQDIISRDIREAKTLTCDNPDQNGKATSLTLSKTGIASDSIVYNFDTTLNPHSITKTEGGATTPSPVTDIEISNFAVFCNDIGNNRVFVTLSVLAEGSPFPYEVSITPRSGVLK